MLIVSSCRWSETVNEGPSVPQSGKSWQVIFPETV